MGVASDIYKAFAELQTACETICDIGDCSKCPLKTACLDDEKTPFGDAVYSTSLRDLKEFIAYAERLTDIGSTRSKQNND